MHQQNAVQNTATNGMKEKEEQRQQHKNKEKKDITEHQKDNTGAQTNADTLNPSEKKW